MDICARRLEDDDDTPEEDQRATTTRKWKVSWLGPWVRWGFPFGGLSVDSGIRQLDRSETADERGHAP